MLFKHKDVNNTKDNANKICVVFFIEFRDRNQNFSITPVEKKSVTKCRAEFHDATEFLRISFKVFLANNKNV